MTRLFLLVGIVVALSSSTGCRKAATDAATCDKVATHTADLARAELAAQVALPAEQRRRAELELGPIHDAIMNVCTDNKWPIAVRACMAAAGTGDEIKQCATSLPAAARAPLVR